MATWKEKYERLCPWANKTALEKAAGWTLGTLSNALAEDAGPPSVDKAIRLAKVLHVDPAWLFDDERDDWPAPGQAASAKETLLVLGNAITQWVEQQDDGALELHARDNPRPDPGSRPTAAEG